MVNESKILYHEVEHSFYYWFIKEKTGKGKDNDDLKVQ